MRGMLKFYLDKDTLVERHYLAKDTEGYYVLGREGDKCPRAVGQLTTDGFDAWMELECEVVYLKRSPHPRLKPTHDWCQFIGIKEVWWYGPIEKQDSIYDPRSSTSVLIQPHSQYSHLSSLEAGAPSLEALLGLLESIGLFKEDMV